MKPFIKILVRAFVEFVHLDFSTWNQCIEFVFATFIRNLAVNLLLVSGTFNKILSNFELQLEPATETFLRNCLQPFVRKFFLLEVWSGTFSWNLLLQPVSETFFWMFLCEAHNIHWNLYLEHLALEPLSTFFIGTFVRNQEHLLLKPLFALCWNFYCLILWLDYISETPIRFIGTCIWNTLLWNLYISRIVSWNLFPERLLLEPLSVFVGTFFWILWLGYLSETPTTFIGTFLSWNLFRECLLLEPLICVSWNLDVEPLTGPIIWKLKPGEPSVQSMAGCPNPK